jgi:hypothetical protein
MPRRLIAVATIAEIYSFYLRSSLLFLWSGQLGGDGGDQR